MLLKNNAKRLIGVNFGGEKFNLKPAGEAVEVPNDAVKTAYVQHLLDSGDIVKASKPKVTKPKSDEKEEV
jgi:hypothetical protein